jgi:glycosyltransferase involved in cell wall biosynthesis
MRILFIFRGVVPPPKREESNRFFFLPESLEGEVLLPVWWSTAQEVREALGPGSYPNHKVKNFHYHFLLAGRSGAVGVRHTLASFRFFLRSGMRLHRERKFDCIFASGHTMTALAGTILRLLTGARLIVELIGTPRNAYRFDRPSRTIVSRIKKLYSDTLLHLTVLSADRVKLLYPDQLRGYPLLRGVPASVLHDFVTLSQVSPTDASENFVLFVGYPWYLKGVDVLIRAFRAVASDYPHIKLRLLGHFPDRVELDALSGDCGQIEFLDARPNPEVLRIMERSMILVLPSRTEGLPRVLLEAMAAKKPIIASDVDGIPHCVRDGYNGLLFRPGDIDDLAEKLRRLLSDGALRERLGRNGLDLARLNYTERAWAEGFEKMMAMLTGR